MILAIRNFPHNAMSIYTTIWTHHYVGRARKPYGRGQDHESASTLSKIISINKLFALAQMRAILDFAAI